MDNASIHSDKLIEKELAGHGFLVYHIPPYSPHLNNAELLIRALKKKLRKLSTEKR